MGEIATYAYLMYCEDRKTYQCYPSFETIGEAIGRGKNSVMKYVHGLEAKRLIYTEPTSITTKDGRKRNGSLLYHKNFKSQFSIYILTQVQSQSLCDVRRQLSIINTKP